MQKNKINIDVSSGLYFTGFLLASGMKYAESGGQLFTAVLHGLISWAYVEYWVVDFLIH